MILLHLTGGPLALISGAVALPAVLGDPRLLPAFVMYAVAVGGLLMFYWLVRVLFPQSRPQEHATKLVKRS